MLPSAGRKFVAPVTKFWAPPEGFVPMPARNDAIDRSARPAHSSMSWARCACGLAVTVLLAAASPNLPAAEVCAPPSETKPPVQKPAVAAPADSVAPADSARPADDVASEKLLAQFRQTYALADGQNVKHVAPPFSPGRLEYYRVHHAHQATLIPAGPEYMWFRWDKRPPHPLPTNWGAYQEGRLSQSGMGWLGGKGVAVADLVESFTDVQPYEMQGEHKLKWARVAGDWVIRDGVPAEKILQQLGAVLRDKCQVPVRFQLAEGDRPVLVVEGKYQYRPLPGRGTLELDHKYNYEGSDLQDYDQLEIFEHERGGLTDIQSGGLDKLLAFLQQILDRPIVAEGVELSADMTTRKPSQKEHLLEWRSAKRYHLRKARDAGTLDVQAILRNLSKQTGLSFIEKPRRGRVLLIERAE